MPRAETPTAPTDSTFTPADHLRAAATLIQRVLDGLDVSAERCSKCDSHHYFNLPQARAAKRLEELPKRLRDVANELNRS